jgi:hypothetical protein
VCHRAAGQGKLARLGQGASVRDLQRRRGLEDFFSGEVDFTGANALVIIAAVIGAANVSFRYIVDRVPG